MENTEGGGLKHLRFVRLLATKAVLVVTNLYAYAKEYSGSLKSTFGTVENAVTSVIGPVYEKTKGIPEEALQFFDKKVEEIAPPVVKKAIAGIDLLVQKSVKAGQRLVHEAKLGPHNFLDFTSSSIKSCAAGVLHVAGYTVNRYPALRTGTDIVLPTFSHISEAYNNIVTKMTAKGFPIVGYLPKVPIDDILTAFKPVELTQSKDADGAVASETK